MRKLMAGLAAQAPTNLGISALDRYPSSGSISSLSTTARTYPEYLPWTPNERAPLCKSDLKGIDFKVDRAQENANFLWPKEPSSTRFEQECIPNSGDFIFHYTDLEARAPLVLVAGVNTHLPVRIKSILVDQIISKEQGTFRADNALPSGLTLEKNSGLVNGKPLEPQEASMYRITFGVDATTPTGLPLGSLVLASCLLSIRVISLHEYMLYSAEADNCMEDVDRLILKLRKS